MASLNFFTLFLYIVVTFISLASGQRCYDTGNFTTNGTYATNRGLLLESLASNVTSNGNFYSTSIGQGNDTVYGHVLCRTDASADDCAQCVNNGIQDLITNCPNQKEALSWGRGDLPPCTIHYANQALSGKMELDPSLPGYLMKDLSSLSINVDQFDQVWSSLMNRVGSKASMGSSKVKSATGEANLTGILTIYVLMQCIPDISNTNCSYCLQRAVAQFRDLNWGKAGGYTLKASCWFRWDLYPFYELTYSPQPSPSPDSILKDGKGIASTTIIIITVVPVVSFLAIAVFVYKIFKGRKPTQEKNTCEIEDDISGTDSLQYDIETIRVATNNFSDDNKLGEGGFGTVYKGRLPDGPAIAVKRWSRTSRQGEDEFKNEVLLVAMLQHRNLVRLLGFCLEDRERLLIYEFVPNLSLDHYIFEANRGFLLDWQKRFRIIEGTARGILYLHQDSRTRIIHRDLKASNILLDEQMNPKISDFGTARLFIVDQSQISTRRIVGTLGYMPPEYAMHGRFSEKSDVFSFGVLILEIMSGQKVSRFCKGEVGENLLTYTWRLWNERTPLNLVHPILLTNSSRQEMLRCIHVALLCVQEDAVMRPTMASVVLMLSSHSVSLLLPSRPAFFMHSTGHREAEASPNPESIIVVESVNEMSITDQCPR